MRCLMLLPALALAACQTYQPMPLDDAAHLDEWQSRNPSHESVTAYAERLGMPDYLAMDGVRLREAEVVALFYNPRLRVARADAGVELATAENAGLWDDPEFSLGVDWLLSSLSRPWVIGASLRVTLPISGRTGVERDHAWARHGEALGRVLEAEWQTVTELRREWLAAQQLAEEHALTTSYLSELESLRDAAGRLEEAGVISRLDTRMLAHEQAAREAELLRATHALEQARARLLELMGLRPGAPLELNLTPPVPPELPTDREAVLHARHPGIETSRRAYAAAEQSLRLEIRKQYPDLSIGPNYELEDGQSKIGIGLGLPIPIINLNRLGIARARAARLAARAVYEAELEAALHALFMAEQRMGHAAAEHRLLIETVASLADQQVADAESLAALGEFDVLRQLDALARRHDTRLRVLDAHVDKVRAGLDVLALLGPDLNLTEDE